ncbi:MAG: phosphatase domain-containing protein [Pseudomonadota bacterium]
MVQESSYQIWKLVNQRIFLDEIGFCHPIQVICDIDKTYLETNFESIAKMAKIALESSEDKITVQGAQVLLNWLRWGEPDDLEGFNLDQIVPLHFVSSSPPQLRRTLEEKLMFDGLLWSSDTFKDQAYNIFKGKFKLLKHQVAYKVAAILNLIARMKDDSHILFIGDNAESDPMIYQSISMLLTGLITESEFVGLLSSLGVKAHQTRDILDRIGDVPRNVKVSILIRRLESYPHRPSPIGGQVTIYYYDHYLELAMHLMSQNLLDPRRPFKLMKEFHNRAGFSLRAIGSALDAARNTFVHMEEVFDEVKRNFAELQIPFESDAWAKEIHEKRWSDFLKLQLQKIDTTPSKQDSKFIGSIVRQRKSSPPTFNRRVELFYQWVEQMKK